VFVIILKAAAETVQRSARSIEASELDRGG
jgi:hypothetical protein